MTCEPAWLPLGRALLAYHRGDHDAIFMVRSTVWEDEPTPAADYYRPDEQALPSLERHALAQCYGRVLDIGAGAGRHALEVQKRGLDVIAIDISPDAVCIMEERGVRDARCIDFPDFDDPPIDTILLLMHGIGVVGTLDGLENFLVWASSVLNKGGQILCDSADLEIAVAESLTRSDDSYSGEVTFRCDFTDIEGASYPWLFIDPETFDFHARTAGFDFEILERGDRGIYLARLTSSTSSTP